MRKSERKSDSSSFSCDFLVNLSFYIALENNPIFTTDVGLWVFALPVNPRLTYLFNNKVFAW